MSQSVYDPEAFEVRVNYAAACIVRANGSVPQGRHFDTCFEMNDGDYVVEALVRRAEKNQRLAAVLYKAIDKWKADTVHEQLKDIPRRQLAAVSRAQIAKWKAEEEKV